MKGSTFRYDFNDLNISASHIETILGYKEGEDRELVTKTIEAILKEAKQFCNIRAEYIIYPDVKFNSSDKSIEINNLRFQIDKIVFGQIKKSESIAVFLCTAGVEVGVRSKKAMQEGDLLKGYLYDIIGSEIVEAATDMMQNELKKSVISSGKKITNRYNPGYCGWNVGEQHKLFRLFPYNFCGIRLTESALMDPVKSVSGIIGIGDNVKYNPYTCSFCDQKDCSYRKIKGKNASR